MEADILKNSGHRSTLSSKLMRLLFVVYLLGLFWLIVLKFNVAFLWLGKERSLNLVPYAEPMILNGRIDINEMILNALVFLPFGVYTAVLFREWSFKKHILVFFLFSLFCEAFQYILAVGAADITDVINNTLGGLIGVLIVRGMENLIGDVNKSTKIISVIAAIAMAILIAFFVFLRITELWMFRMYTIPL